MHPLCAKWKLSSSPHVGKPPVKETAMFERLLLPDDHAIAILMKDHDRVKELFDRFEKSESEAEKEGIIGEAVNELKMHAVIEEEIFYPVVRRHVGKDLMNEADEEHHVARVLIAELDEQALGDDHRAAKFTVLAESVRHHITEEEGDMMPKAKELKIDFEALGAEILNRKEQLRRDGIPGDAEHAMVAAANGNGDTPATVSRRTSPRRALATTRLTTARRVADKKGSSGRRAGKNRIRKPTRRSGR